MWTNIVLAIITIFIYLGPFVHPRQLWIFTLLGMGYPYILGMNLFYLFVWAVYKKKAFVISLIIILLGISNVDRLVGINFSEDYQKIEGDISLLSYNAQSFDGKNDFPENFKQLTNLMRTKDIILLQEIPHRIFEQLKIEFSKFNAYKDPDLRLVILSRFPIINQGVANRQNASNGSIWIDANINGQLHRVYNVHLHSYRVAGATEEILDGELADDKTWSKIGTLLGRIKERSQLRSDQVDLIKKQLQLNDKPTILGGDFNATPISYTYHHLSEDLQDTFCVKGKGFGTTYAGKIPLLRIDYIFADAHFEIVQHEVIHSPISDHYPIISVIRLQPNI